MAYFDSDHFRSLLSAHCTTASKAVLSDPSLVYNTSRAEMLSSQLLHVPNMTSEKLLQRISAGLRKKEIVHNWGADFNEMTGDTSLGVATNYSWFLNLWQLRALRLGRDHSEFITNELTNTSEVCIFGCRANSTPPGV